MLKIQTENETNNPKTGDNITTSVILFVAYISTIGILIVINRKKVNLLNGLNFLIRIQRE